MAESYTFPQLQGPQIDIGLYPDAVSAGINQGNSQLTTTQAKQQGSDIASAKLNASVQGLAAATTNAVNTYNAIQDAPIKREAAELNNQRTEMENQILQKQIDSGQADLEIQTKNAQLKLTAEQTQTKLADITQIKSIQEQLGYSPSQALADIQNDPAKRQALLRNPDEGNQVVAQLKAAGIPESQYADIASSINAAAEKKVEIERGDATIKARAAAAAENKKEYVKSDSELVGLTRGKLPDAYDPRTLDVRDIPVDLNDTTRLPGDPKQKGIFQGDKLIETLATAEEATRASRAIANVTAYQIGKGLLKTPAATVTPDAPPTAPATGSGAARAFGMSVAQPQATPTPTPSATPPADSIPGQSNDAITNQARADLLRRADNDKSIRDRLVAKGIMKEKPPTPAPVGAPAPGASVATPTATPGPQAPLPGTAPATLATPAPRVTPATPPVVVDTRVAEVHKTLPKPVQTIVSPKVVKQVATDPALQNLNPLQKAVVSVESGGIADARPPGFDNKKVSAEGYFQLTNGAAKDTKVNKSIPEENIQGGVEYLNTLMSRYNNNESAALMAYNVGMGVIDAAITLGGSGNYDDIAYSLDYMQDRGMFPRQLTPENLKIVKRYPLKVLAYKQMYQSL